MTDRAAVFDALYARDADPWSFLDSAYEAEKYAATLTALSRPRYRATLEVGCSIGVMTARLAVRSDRVVALDVSAVALTAARERCAGLAVEFVRTEVPGGWPSGSFDLIVLSELLYFLRCAEVAACAVLAARGLAEGGEIVLVNWLGATDTPTTGDGACEIFAEAARAEGLFATPVLRAERYRIDRVTRMSPPPVR